MNPSIHVKKKKLSNARCQNLNVKSRNMNHYTVMNLREKLENLSISDYQGLKGPGLTCYLNSVLQVLFMTEDFREAVKRNCSEKPTSIDAHLGDLFSMLEREMAQTHNIVIKLGIKDVYEQRDAAEYFEKILCRTSPEASKIFKGELNHKSTCLKCNKTDDSKNFFWVLPLSMGDPKSSTYSVRQGLNSFLKVQTVCEDNQMFCTRCNEKQDAKTEYEMTHPPDVLALLLKRFSFDYQQNCYVKLQCKAKVVQTLEIKNCRYRLYAVVHHYGDLMGGHYTADIQSFETGNWYCFNDNTVKSVHKLYSKSEHKSISSTTAYLLMYKMVSGRDKKTDGSALEAYCGPSDETEDRCNEAEPREDLISEHLLQTESRKAEGIPHLDGEIIRNGVNCSSSFRGWNKQPHQVGATFMPQGSMRLSADKTTKERMCYINTEKPSDWKMPQRSIAPIKDVGVNELRDQQGNNKTKTRTNTDLYNHSPPRGRIKSAVTTVELNHKEAPAVVTGERNGRTITEKTYSNNVGNYNANLHYICSPTSSPTRSSQSFRTAAGPSGSPAVWTTSQSFKGKHRPKILSSSNENKVKPSDPNIIKQHWR